MIDGSCQTFVSDCQVRAAAELINHAWDPVVLSALRLGPTRRKELLMRIAGVSDKVLTQALQRLQARGLVVKVSSTDQASGRAGVVYQLSMLGESFANGPLAQLAQWAADNQDELVGNVMTDNAGHRLRVLGCGRGAVRP
ncbi:helix-turn-helix domain-containing protein [Microbispora sp. CSR-4]|uniref:winged helix-turn-helix transcriptional regulator n=1 Tax=Microbispora sp. CSR-4 TaxID=2592813 RepID=UPI0011CC86A6|nr:helix-turn-helix domain-containing protein [Microbispora sp. CSR-4]